MVFNYALLAFMYRIIVGMVHSGSDEYLLIRIIHRCTHIGTKMYHTNTSSDKSSGNYDSTSSFHEHVLATGEIHPLYYTLLIGGVT